MVGTGRGAAVPAAGPIRVFRPAGAGVAIRTEPASDQQGDPGPAVQHLAEDRLKPADRRRSGNKNPPQAAARGGFSKSGGTPTWTRTKDQKIKSLLLYQLSYRGVGPALRRGRKDAFEATRRKRNFAGFSLRAPRGGKECRSGSGRKRESSGRPACRSRGRVAGRPWCWIPDGRKAAIRRRGQW